MQKKKGIWGKLVEYLGFGPEDEDFDEESDDSPAQADEWPSDIKRPADRRAAVVPITSIPPKQATFKVLVVEPRSFEEVQTIVDQMRARRPVILNLEALDKDLAQKILNFLNGAIYALGGETQRVAQGIFFFAPQGTDIATMGRGLTGTAIGGGAVDLPPGVLEKLTGNGPTVAQPKEEAAGLSARSLPYTSREESDLLIRATGRKSEEEGRPKIDWRSK